MIIDVIARSPDGHRGNEAIFHIKSLERRVPIKSRLAMSKYMMKKILFLILNLLFFSVISVRAANAQYFKFNLVNQTQPIPVGTNFQVQILINTNNIPSINGDALITYDSLKLKINSALDTPKFFTYFSANPLGGTSNKYLVSSWEESVARAKATATDTVFGTLNLTALAAGTANLSFDCTAGLESDSNINQASDSKDIIDCTKVTALALNIGSGSSTSTTPSPSTGSISPTIDAGVTSTPVPSSTPTETPTLTPTRTPTNTRTPTPDISELPRTGAVETTLTFLGIGTLLIVVGVIALL